MNQYFTPSGLDLLSEFESGGNPTAQSSSSSASGLYGFLSGTWAQFAPQAGVDTSLYPTAASASPDVQTAVAAVTPISNWTCPGCDPGITAAIAGDSSLVANTPSLSVSGMAADTTGLDQDFSGGVSGESWLNDIAGSVGMGDNPYQPVPAGSAAGSPGASALPGSTSSVWNALFADIENIATRFGLVLLGIVLVGVGAWAAAHGEFRG